MSAADPRAPDAQDGPSPEPEPEASSAPASTSSSLHAELFDADLALDPSAGPGVGLRDAPWPGNLPSLEESLALLRGRPAGEVLAKIAGPFIASLSALERQVLAESELGIPGADVGARALASRLRLELALKLAPKDGPCSDEAMEALLSESDSALTELNAQAASEVLAPVAPQLREALVRNAVQLTELAATLVRKEVDSVASTQVDKKYERVARRVRVFEGKDGAERGRSRFLPLVFAITVLGAGAFHTYRFLHLPRDGGPMEGLPPGTTGAAPAKGSAVVQITDPSKLKDPKVRAEIAERAAKNNQKAVEVVPGQFLFVPQQAQMAPPAHAGPANVRPPVMLDSPSPEVPHGP